MSGMPWEEYLDRFVDDYRREFVKLFGIPAVRGYLSKIKLEDRSKYIVYSYILSFLEPCQICVLEFSKIGTVIWRVANDITGEDKHFGYVLENTKPEERLRKVNSNWDGFWEASVLFESSKGTNAKELIEISEQHEETWFKFEFDPRNELAFDVVGSLLRQVSRRYVYGRIEDATESLRTNIKEIVDQTLREKMLNVAKDLESSLSQIKELDKQMTVVKNLMRTSEDFKDVLVLMETVKEIRENYVKKEVLKEQLNRFDDRISAMNTRISDLKAIKFWSKRTVVDVVLAIIAAVSTVIAALIAAGILKF